MRAIGNLLSRASAGVRHFIKSEPLLIASLAVTVEKMVETYNATGQVDWRWAIPAAAGAILRQFVTSPASAEELRRDLELAKSALNVASTQTINWDHGSPVLGVQVGGALKAAGGVVNDVEAQVPASPPTA